MIVFVLGHQRSTRRCLREKRWLRVLIAAAGDSYEVWVPSVVIEELVRQFPERLKTATKALQEARHDVSAFGFRLPSLPNADLASATLRADLLQHR